MYMKIKRVVAAVAIVVQEKPTVSISTKVQTMSMPVITTADTKRRLVETVTKIVNEIAIVTEEDLAKVKQKIEEKSHDILVSDSHTYHTLDVMLTIFPRETLHGQVEISVAAILWQR